LLGLSAQVLLTGTDPEPFAALRGQAEWLRTGDGALTLEDKTASPPPSGRGPG